MYTSKHEMTSEAKRGQNVEEGFRVPSRPKISIISEFSMSNSFNRNRVRLTVDQNPKELRPLNNDVHEVQNTIYDAGLQRINADNPISVPKNSPKITCNEKQRRYRYSPVTNTRHSNYSYVPPPLNTSHYSNVLKSLHSNAISRHRSNTLYTQPSSAMNFQNWNSVGWNTQNAATTNYSWPNQSDTNGLQNAISNSDSIYNASYQYTMQNNTANINDNPSEHINLSLPNTNLQLYCTGPCCNNSQMSFTESSTLSSTPGNPSPFKIPAPYNIRPPSNTSRPLVNSSRTSPAVATSFDQYYGKNQCPECYNNPSQSSVMVQQSEGNTNAMNFQSPRHDFLVSPDYSFDAQSPSMPIESLIDSSNMCMARNCTNIPKYNCCLTASYCSYKCQKYDWYFHKNECYRVPK